MTKLKNPAGKDFNFKTIEEHRVKILSVSLDGNNRIKNGDSEQFTVLLHELNFTLEWI